MKTAYSAVPPYSQLPLSIPYEFLAFTAPKKDGESKYNYYWNEWLLPNDAFWTIGTHHIKNSTKYSISKSKVDVPMWTIEICNWNTTYPFPLLLWFYHMKVGLMTFLGARIKTDANFLEEVLGNGTSLSHQSCRNFPENWLAKLTPESMEESIKWERGTTNFYGCTESVHTG